MNEKPNFREGLILGEIGDTDIVERNGEKQIRSNGMYISISDKNPGPEKVEQIKRLSFNLGSVLREHELMKGRIQNIQNGNVYEGFDTSTIMKETQPSIKNKEEIIGRIERKLKQLGVIRITGTLEVEL